MVDSKEYLELPSFIESEPTETTAALDVEDEEENQEAEEEDSPIGQEEEKGKKEKDPEIARDPKDVQPVLYSFKVPYSPDPGSIMKATLPPHWIYLDHAFGVIWVLFHKDKRFVGISQLHWCLRFLGDLRDSSGEYTGDVNICIQAVQDYLIEQYAKMGSTLKQKSSTAETGSVKKENEDAEEDDEARNETIQAGSGKNAPVADLEDDVELPDSFGIDEEDSTGGTVMKTSSPKYITAVEDSEKCASSCERSPKTSKEASAKTKSLIYDQMASRGPVPCVQDSGFSDATFFEPFDSTFIMPESLTRDLNQIPDSSRHPEEFMKSLEKMRSKLVEKIKMRIEELFQLERYMASINIEGFVPHITDEFAARLHKLEARDVVEGVENLI